MFGEYFKLPFGSVLRERREKMKQAEQPLSDDPVEAYIYRCIQEGLYSEQQILFLLGESGNKDDTLPLPSGKRI